VIEARQHAALCRAIDEMIWAGRQLVLAAARPPDALECDTRLGSLIDVGLIVPIAAPYRDGRAAILRSQLATMMEHGRGEFASAIGDDIVAAIAAAGPATPRCLGGILNDLYADHLLRGLAPTVERARLAVAIVSVVSVEARVIAPLRHARIPGGALRDAVFQMSQA
jgi:chromosomal replication initiation ATPase DnaA